MFSKDEREDIDLVLIYLDKLRVKLVKKSYVGLSLREQVNLNQINMQIEHWEQVRFNGQWD